VRGSEWLRGKRVSESGKRIREEKGVDGRERKKRGERAGSNASEKKNLFPKKKNEREKGTKVSRGTSRKVPGAGHREKKKNPSKRGGERKRGDEEAERRGFKKSLGGGETGQQGWSGSPCPTEKRATWKKEKKRGLQRTPG